MTSLFSAEFYRNNRRNLARKCKDDAPIVLTAHGLLQRGGDSTFPFHQDSNFWYLTGVNEPDLLLVIEGDTEYLIIPGRSASREAFDGAVDKRQITKISGIKELLDEEPGWQRLGAALKRFKTVQTLPAPAAYIEQYGMYTNPARTRLIERLKNWQPDATIIDIREHLIHLRMIKQPEELQAIQEAIDITNAGIASATSPESLKKFTYEFEIENALTTAFRTPRSSGHAFAPIVAAGKRGVTLHNVDNVGKLKTQDCIVIDVGAEVEHYAADITRTIMAGEPSGRQQQIYDAVLEVQEYALTLLKPGQLLKEYELAVEDFMGQKLIALGLIEAVSHEAVRKYYPHATSHFLGLDVHDVGDYARPLEEGMVVTCEPGIYVSEEGIGVRLEDDVLITKNGNTVLSGNLPKQLSAHA